MYDSFDKILAAVVKDKTGTVVNPISNENVVSKSFLSIDRTLIVRRLITIDCFVC